MTRSQPVLERFSNLVNGRSETAAESFESFDPFLGRPRSQTRSLFAEMRSSRCVRRLCTDCQYPGG
jgi:hypothetical protein